MSVQGVTAGLSPALTGTAGRFYMPGAAEFADKLTVGQILKGRVLRQYDQSRYLVGFDGHERVVDSTVPMRTGELIQGRVIGIGERVELQRVYGQDGDGADALAPLAREPAVAGAGGPVEQQLSALFARYQVDLGPADRALLAKSMRTAGDGATMGLAGVMLHKLGLPQSAELLGSLYGALLRRGEARPAEPPLAELETVRAAPAELQAVAVRQLGDTIRSALDATPARDPDEARAAPAGQDANGAAPAQGAAVEAARAPRPDDERRGQRELRDLGRWLLNAQSGASVAHRHGTLALLLGRQLVEVDVALFAQQRDADQKPAAQHRQIVLALNTEELGRIEIATRVVGQRLSVRVRTESSDQTARLAEYSDALRASLAALGWTVDELSYETGTLTANGATRAVVEHVIRQDSLNRLI